MPLKPGRSLEAFSSNLRTLKEEGKSHAQALAIAIQTMGPATGKRKKRKRR